MGGGVCGAIFKAAGAEEMERALQGLAHQHRRCGGNAGICPARPVCHPHGWPHLPREERGAGSSGILLSKQSPAGGKNAPFIRRFPSDFLRHLRLSRGGSGAGGIGCHPQLFGNPRHDGIPDYPEGKGSIYAYTSFQAPGPTKGHGLQQAVLFPAIP